MATALSSVADRPWKIPKRRSSFVSITTSWRPIARPAADGKRASTPTCERPRESSRADSRRDAMRGDDLIGSAAGDFGHAVELPGETAGARGRRAQLHD